jgi:hypothetical protein
MSTTSRTGPRSYDAEGELLYTTSFAHGTVGEVKFTRAGLAVLSNEANEYLRQGGKQVFVYPSGDTGITMEHTAPILSPGRLSPEDAQRVRRKFLPLMCGLLTRYPDLQSIDLRLFWAGGEIASVEKFRAQQCVASSYPLRRPPVSPHEWGGRSLRSRVVVESGRDHRFACFRPLLMSNVRSPRRSHVFS